MKVLYSTKDLFEELVCLCLRQATIWDNIIKQLSTNHVLHDHENVSRCFDNPVQSDNILVSNELVATNAHPLELCINVQNNTMKRSVAHQFRTGFFKSKGPRPLKHITLSRKFSSAQLTGTNAARLNAGAGSREVFHTPQSLSR